ncbi:hypothetical protein BaRGS_00035359, partial [Batillaria attramentaria]
RVTIPVHVTCALKRVLIKDVPSCRAPANYGSDWAARRPSFARCVMCFVPDLHDPRTAVFGEKGRSLAEASSLGAPN